MGSGVVLSFYILEMGEIGNRGVGAYLLRGVLKNR